MPSKQLGAFLNSTPGFWVLCAGLLVLILAGRFLVKKSSGKDYLGQATVLITLALVATVFLILTIWFPIRGEVPATVVPRLWIVGIYACLIYLTTKIVSKTEDTDKSSGKLGLPFKFIAAMIGYIVLMVLIGYFIASLVFIAVTMTMLSYRRRFVILAISAGWMVFSYLVFYRLLYVPLPQGLVITAIFG